MNEISKPIEVPPPKLEATPDRPNVPDDWKVGDPVETPKSMYDSPNIPESKKVDASDSPAEVRDPIERPFERTRQDPGGRELGLESSAREETSFVFDRDDCARMDRIADVLADPQKSEIMQVTPEAWQEMDRDQRGALLEQAHQSIAGAMGIEPVASMDLPSQRNDRMGQYLPESDHININMNAWDHNTDEGRDNAVQTLLHESRHAYQAQHPEMSKQIVEYTSADEDRNAYESDQLEQDSRAFAEQTWKRIVGRR